MTKSTRATNIQVPGAQPPAEQPGNDQGTTTGAADAPGASSAGEKPETAVTTAGSSTTTGAADVFDIDALRAQIRLEEQARARAELASQIQAASTVVAADVAAPAAAPRARADYKTMRADQVDPATLTAPVMTRDGWVCPVPPEKK